jgi:hypothetical protein
MAALDEVPGQGVADVTRSAAQEHLPRFHALQDTTEAGPASDVVSVEVSPMHRWGAVAKW